MVSIILLVNTFYKWHFLFLCPLLLDDQFDLDDHLKKTSELIIVYIRNFQCKLVHQQI